MRTEGTDEVHRKTVDALIKFAASVRNAGLYGRSHPVTGESVTVAYDALAHILRSEQALTVAVTPDYLALDSFPLEASGLADLSESLFNRRIGKVRFVEGLSADEIADFAEVMVISPEDLDQQGGIGEQLRLRNISHIQLSRNSIPMHRHEGRDPADVYEESLILIEDAMKTVQSGFAISVQEIKGVVEDTLQCMTNDETALLALSGIRSYDKYLYEHSVNVCILSMVLGRDLGMHHAATLDLGICAMLHDIGKVFIPSQIITKPAKLTEEEWEAIRLHPARGAQALAGLPDLPPLSATIALEHHAYSDGSGYPAFSYERPHLLSRLVAIVDTYDALTTDRPYRERWTGSEAIAYMLYEMPDRYDRQLLAKFADRARLYPTGSLVRLANGELAIVIGGTRSNPDRPMIRIVSRDRRLFPGTIDLAENSDAGYQILEVAQPVEALLRYTDLLMAA